MSTITIDSKPSPAMPMKPTLANKKLQDKKILSSETTDASASTASSTEKNGDGILTTSLSFDQVNNNADELIELRGEGRYFGVTDPTSGKTINSLQSAGPLCANCHKRGHIRAKCKTVVCHKCGVVGDHYETQCPTTMVCSRCGLKGHVASSCTNKQKKKEYCKLCDTFNHGDDRCPSIWRSYITIQLTKEEKESTVLPVIYCYNCGDENHFGDECEHQRSSRIPNSTGSAFSGSNLPQHLRDLYFKRSRSYSERDYGSGSRYGSQSSYSSNNSNNSYGNRDYGYNSNRNNNNSYNNSYNNSGYNNNNNNNNNNPNNGGYNSKRDFNKRDYTSNSKSSKKSFDTGYKPSSQTDGIRKPSRTGVLSKKKLSGSFNVPSHTPYNSPYQSQSQSNGYQAPTRLGILSSRIGSNKSKSKQLRKFTPNY